MRLPIAAAVLLLAGGCVLPFATPPLHAEMGGTSFSGRHAPAFHVGGGAALASATIANDQPIDLGVGGFVDMTPETASTHASARMNTSTTTSTSTSGVYVDAAMFIDHRELTRTSLGLRGELRWNGAATGAGAKLRLELELFTSEARPFSGRNRCGVVAGWHQGTSAIGIYSEAGRVWQPDGVPAWTATAGITLRLPLSAGFYLAAPVCK